MFLHLYLDQASVLSIVQIFENTLFPITSQSSWRSLKAWGSLAPLIPYVTFGSSWSLSACGPLKSQFSWGSLFTCEALVSRLSCVALVPLWSRRTTRTGWSCDARGSRGSRGSWASGNAWYPWCAKGSTISIWSIWWIWVSSLCQIKDKKKQKQKKKKTTRNFVYMLSEMWLFFLWTIIVTNSSF